MCYLVHSHGLKWPSIKGQHTILEINLMANHASAVKRDRQNQKRRAINRSHAQRLRSQLKRIRQAVTTNDIEKMNALLSPTLSLIDKSIQKGLLHKNAASRYKSRLMHKINAVRASQPAA